MRGCCAAGCRCAGRWGRRCYSGCSGCRPHPRFPTMCTASGGMGCWWPMAPAPSGFGPMKSSPTVPVPPSRPRGRAAWFCPSSSSCTGSSTRRITTRFIRRCARRFLGRRPACFPPQLPALWCVCGWLFWQPRRALPGCCWPCCPPWGHPPSRPCATCCTRWSSWSSPATCTSKALPCAFCCWPCGC